MRPDPGIAEPHPDAVPRAVADLAAGRAVLVVGDEEPGGVGALVFAAESATTALVAFTVRHTSGYLCVAMPGTDCDRLRLPPMVPGGGAGAGRAFTVTVDAAHGVSTGISARDRAHTLRVLAGRGTLATDLVRPGHLAPLRARDGGVLQHPGRVEAAVDLLVLAGTAPVAAMCEVVSPSGSGQLAAADELAAFATEHDLRIVRSGEVAAYRWRMERQVDRVASARLPTDVGRFVVHGYRALSDRAEHLAVVAERRTEPPAAETVAVHVECTVGQALGGRVCRCADRLRAALTGIAEAGSGLLVYLRPAGSAASLSCPALSAGTGGVPLPVLAAHIVADLVTGPVALVPDQDGRPDVAQTVALEQLGVTVVGERAVQRIGSARRARERPPAAMTGSGR